MKKLKPTILFISENFLPETNAAAARVFERGIYWKEWGYKVKYITSFPNRHMGKAHKGYSDKLFQNEIIDGHLVCPRHHWKFSLKDGNCINNNSKIIMELQG